MPSLDHEVKIAVFVTCHSLSPRCRFSSLGFCGKMAVSILITGGAGFVGSAIIDAVQEKHPQWKVSVLDIQILSHPRKNVHYELGDITIPTDVERIMHVVRPVAIIHSAGLVPELSCRYNRKARDRVFNVNVEGTRNILTIARSAGVEVLVWTGSCTAVTDDVRFEYPNIDESWPTSSCSLVYGESKASSRRVAHNRQSLMLFRLLPKPWSSPPTMRNLLLVH